MIANYKDATGQDTLSSDEYQMLYQDYNNQPDPSAKKDEEKAELRNMINQMGWQANPQARRGGAIRSNRLKTSGYRLNDWLKQIK